jgi:hypothetical protein
MLKNSGIPNTAGGFIALSNPFGAGLGKFTKPSIMTTSSLV